MPVPRLSSRLEGLLITGVFVACALAASAQGVSVAKAQPELEAATVRWLCHSGPSGGCSPRLFGPNQRDPSRFACNSCNLDSMVAWAYGVHSTQLKRMPKWAQEEIYRTVIVASAPATLGQMKLFMRTVLADASGLQCRIEKKPTPVYRLEIGKKGPKFHRASKAEPETKAEMMGGVRRTSTVQGLVAYLNSLYYSGSPTVSRPVEDGTGLAGTFDIVLNLGTGPTMSGDLIQMVREQLGLKAVVVPGHATHLIIDSITPRTALWTKG